MLRNVFSNNLQLLYTREGKNNRIGSTSNRLENHIHL